MVDIFDLGPVKVYKMGPQFCGRVLYPVYAFLVEGLLIDTGSKSARRHILKHWKEAEISQIVNTHWHEDHVGNNKALQELKKAPIFAHPQDIPYIEAVEAQKYWAYERVTWGIPENSRVQAVPSVIATKNYEFHVIHTPGHTPGHIALFEPKLRYLFSGDLYMGTKMVYLRTFETFEDQLASLKRVAELNPVALFCSFRGVVMDGAQKLHEKIQFMEELKANAYELADRGLSITAIRNKLLGKEDFMTFLTRNDFSKIHVISRILGERKKNTEP